jgi:hypothetical protein
MRARKNDAALEREVRLLRINAAARRTIWRENILSSEVSGIHSVFQRWASTQNMYSVIGGEWDSFGISKVGIHTSHEHE